MQKLIVFLSLFVLLVSCGGETADTSSSSKKKSQTKTIVEDTLIETATGDLLSGTGETIDDDTGETFSFTGSEVSGELIHIFNYASGSSLDSSEPKASQPKESNEMMLILDVSGSMAGVLGGKIKMETAREVVKEVTQKYDETTKLGFMAYGHNRKGDCSDIETLLEPGLGNAEEISSLLDGLTPTGMTPMGASVSQAIDQLQGKQNASIALVTDGIETCDVNICDLGKKLNQENIDLNVHVVSFGVDEKDTKNMQCLAEQTGGQFLTAQDASSLGDALDNVVSASSCGNYESERIDMYIPETVIAGSNNKIKWLRTIEGGYDRIAFAKVGDEEVEILDTFYASTFESKKLRDGNYSYELTAPETPGTYQIIYQAHCGDIILQHDVEVVEAKTIIQFPAEVVSGSNNTVKWLRSTDADYDKIGFAKVGDTVEMLDSFYASTFENEKLRDGSYSYHLTAPEIPGEYEVIYITEETKEILFQQTVRVVQAEVSLDFPAEVVSGSNNTVKWLRSTDADYDKIGFAKVGDTVEMLDSFYASTFEDRKIRDGRSAYHLTAPETPGTYEVIYITEDSKEILAQQTVQVIQSEVDIDISSKAIAGEPVEITWTRTTNADYDKIAFAKVDDTLDIETYFYASTFEKEDEKKHTYKLKAPETPGTYELIYVTEDNQDILFQKTVKVK